MEMNQYFYEYQPPLMYVPQVNVINYQPAPVYSEHMVQSPNFGPNIPKSNVVDPASYLIITQNQNSPICIEVEPNYWFYIPAAPEMEQIAINPQFIQHNQTAQIPMPYLASHQTVGEVELEQNYNGEHSEFSFANVPPSQCIQLNQKEHVVEGTDPSVLSYTDLGNVSAQSTNYSSEDDSETTTEATIRINDNIDALTHTSAFENLSDDLTFEEFEEEFFDGPECSSVVDTLVNEPKKRIDTSPVTSTPVRAIRFPVDSLYSRCNDCNQYYGQPDDGIELQCLCNAQTADS